MLLDGKNEIEEIISGKTVNKEQPGKLVPNQHGKVVSNSGIGDIRQLFTLPGFKVSDKLKRKMKEKAFGKQTKGK